MKENERVEGDRGQNKGILMCVCGGERSKTERKTIEGDMNEGNRWMIV